MYYIIICIYYICIILLYIYYIYIYKTYKTYRIKLNCSMFTTILVVICKEKKSPLNFLREGGRVHHCGQ